MRANHLRALAVAILTACGVSSAPEAASEDPIEETASLSEQDATHDTDPGPPPAFAPREATRRSA